MDFIWWLLYQPLFTKFPLINDWFERYDCVSPDVGRNFMSTYKQFRRIRNFRYTSILCNSHVYHIRWIDKSVIKPIRIPIDFSICDKNVLMHTVRWQEIQLDLIQVNHTATWCIITNFGRIIHLDYPQETVHQSDCITIQYRFKR